MRNPRTATKSSPHSPQLEKSRAQQRRPNAAKKRKKKKFLLRNSSYNRLQITLTKIIVMTKFENCKGY